MASNKNQKRPYRQKARARQHAETRDRIAAAAVELHGTVGPALTTVKEVAERAGVQRMTVYNHFATDAELMDACSSAWMSRRPPPDPATWTDADPEARCAAALDELYRWYAASRDMLGNVLRDAPLVPALAEVMARKWDPLMTAMVAALARGRNLRGRQRRQGLAALRLAVDFGTWRTLTAAGLDHESSVALATRLAATV